MSLSTDTVIVKAEAYVKMLLHVLRFGSDELDKKLWKEAMGLCVGKIENEQVIIYDAIPITHGKRIEVAWDENDYARFQMLEENLPEGMFIVGWYHSHPGMGAFLSAADLNNHFFWQEVNPKAVALVFDHTLLSEEGHDGFEIFRMNDVSLGPKSDFHSVKYEVQLPENKSIYRKFVEIANNFHRKDPLILEEGEIVDVFETFKLGKAEKPEVDDLKTYVVNNTTIILQTIRDLKNSLGGGIVRLQNWFQKALREGIANPLGDLEIQLWELTEQVKNALNLKEEQKEEKGSEEKEQQES
ncbi:MAG: Mov34/MPN/PAD-1 family protein [Promethearchaeota archaeon]